MMALPQLNTVNYDLVIPSTGQQIKYRPFVVREEKVLLTALESGDAQQITNGMRDIVKVCTFNEVDIKQLAMYDLEYIFLKLRAKSVGEKATLLMKCQEDECGHETPVEVNLDEVELVGDPKAQDTISITDKVGISFKFPTVGRMEEVMKGLDAKTNIDVVLGMMVASIESIYDEEKVYPSVDSTPKELLDFIESLSKQQFETVQSFFDKFPKLKKEIKWVCEKCGKENSVVLEGLNDFFA
tara:strand:- start:292 stop:1014 length:723 start_codon:yes stop_codon:yes gene_type:complete